MEFASCGIGHVCLTEIGRCGGKAEVYHVAFMLLSERAAFPHHFHPALIPFSVPMRHGATLPKEEYARAAHPKKHVKIGAICKRNRVVVQPLTRTRKASFPSQREFGKAVVEDSESQAAAWELFFGDVFDQWSETGKLPEGDLYWQAYNGQSETEGDQ